MKTQELTQRLLHWIERWKACLTLHWTSFSQCNHPITPLHNQIPLLKMKLGLHVKHYSDRFTPNSILFRCSFHFKIKIHPFPEWIHKLLPLTHFWWHLYYLNCSVSFKTTQHAWETVTDISLNWRLPWIQFKVITSWGLVCQNAR